MENNVVGMNLQESCTVGFMDLLGVVHQDSSRYSSLIHKPPMQLPETPKSSSSEALTKKRDKEEDEEEQEYKRKKRVKSDNKSSNKTKMRVPKVTFITKSEVLHLEDGYKWRKYGQKPVKNSPFPRHYYRCTTIWCDVKKRVERSFSDPSNVITTYEGQHTHFRPLIIMPKTSNSGSSTCSASGSYSGQLPTLPPQLLHYNNQQHELPFSGTNGTNRQGHGYEDDDDGDHVMTKSRTRDFLDEGGLVKDHGLLQDVVSSHIIKQESTS